MISIWISKTIASKALKIQRNGQKQVDLFKYYPHERLLVEEMKNAE